MQSAKLRNLVSIEDLSASTLQQILKQANAYLQQPKLFNHNLQHKVVANLFLEPSTRTLCSFELAGKRLGAEVMNVDCEASSLRKGESLFDMVDTLAAIGVDCFIIRHAEDGTAAAVAEHLQGRAAVINAGDGKHEHPTQGLLDMLTIMQHKPNLSGLSVAIAGDIRHSRVARSDMQALRALGVKDIRLIGPAAFMPDNTDCQIVADFEEGLRDVDVIMLLRIQKERLGAEEMQTTQDYFAKYGLNQQRLKLAKPDALVMHPGPMNRGVEVADDVADGPQSVILQQVTCGVAVRMAVLEYCLA